MGLWDWLQKEIAVMTRLESIPLFVVSLSTLAGLAVAEDKRPHISIRGIYGGVPVELLEHGTLVCSCSM